MIDIKEIHILILCYRADAKLLWMRVPANLRDDKELIQLNLLNIALQNNNYADFFKHIKYEWSERVKSPVEDLLSTAMPKSLLIGYKNL